MGALRSDSRRPSVSWRVQSGFTDRDDVGDSESMKHVGVESMIEVSEVEERKNARWERSFEPRVVEPARIDWRGL